MTNREICLKAAERLREVGWRQGGYGGEDGPHCILGACQWAAAWYTNAAAARMVARRAARAAVQTPCTTNYCDRGGNTPIAWNDEPGRTMEEVIAVLEACP